VTKKWEGWVIRKQYFKVQIEADTWEEAKDKALGCASDSHHASVHVAQHKGIPHFSRVVLVSQMTHRLSLSNNLYASVSRLAQPPCPR
jgi:hypothetical protein